MTARDEDAPRVLIFADILGFEQMTREIRVRVEDYPTDEHGFTGSGTTELQGRFVRFSNVLDRHVFEESLNGGVQAMLFSDCGFFVYENALRAALASASLMRAFITRGVPVRMGFGKGTFYDMEYETNATGRESHVVSKSRFYGTAVIHAHAAEQCGGNQSANSPAINCGNTTTSTTITAERPKTIKGEYERVPHALCVWRS